VDPITSTARWTAAQRARESERPDHLFVDPLASALAGDEGRAMLEQSELARPVSDAAPYLAVRTSFFDEFLLREANTGLRQVVIVAAGMDSRAYRLSWPAGTTIYELDRPELLALKDEILARVGAVPACRRVPVGVDLESDWPASLLATGFAPADPTLWLVEGLTYYLEEAACARLLDRLSSLAAPGSRLGVDLVSASFLTSPWTQNALQAMAGRGMAWRFGNDDPEAFLAAHGWQSQVIQPGDADANYGRWPHPVPPRNLRESPHSFLVIGRKG
jgi:methyltransferase (TIGR00027 family)